MITDIMKKCPRDETQLETIEFHTQKVERCPFCGGIWFEHDELRKAKDSEDEFLKWFDVDLWPDSTRFKMVPTARICSKDGVVMYRTHYDGSGVIVDVCNMCQGIWLDEGEYRAIIDWIRAKVDREAWRDYLKAIGQETVEVFTGPEGMRSEFADLTILLKLLSYKFLARWPLFTRLIAQLPT